MERGDETTGNGSYTADDLAALSSTLNVTFYTNHLALKG